MVSRPVYGSLWMSRRDSEPYLMTRVGDCVAGVFAIEALLGVGGMGSAWAARDLRDGAEVVVKFHESGFAGADAMRALKRFLREAQVLSAVDHPNVCRLVTAGLDPETGEPYIVLERLRGATLAARLRGEPRLPVPVAFAIAADVAAGLQAAHDAEVLHRDVKPENVFLHQGSGEPAPKLIDFGLARPFRSDQVITVGDVAVGTPGYMAPEQIRGRTLDGRADVYGLGVTLYEMITGALPVRARTVRELAIATVTEEPIPASRLVQGIDPLVEEILATATARDRDARFATARALREVLRSYLT